jgi:hypothetical protein
MIFEGIRLGSQGNAEKDKIKATLKFLLEEFLCIDDV